MGASSSTHSGGAGAHPLGATIPEDPVPYRGPQIEYCFVNVVAKLKTNLLVNPMVTTNIDEYYQTVCQPYTQGFVMQQFVKIPGVGTVAGFSSISSIATPYQGILVKPLNVPTPERWQLKIEKSFLETNTVYNFLSSATVTAHTTEIQQKVIDVAAQCGRLICIETTGFQKNKITFSSGVKGVSGVDLFFNMPLHPNPIRYVYQAVNVPISSKLKSLFPTPVIQMETDVIGIYTAKLDQGWKLVEINYDTSQVSKQKKSEQNSIWFFEKEESRVNDDSPVWQGCVIEYMHKTTVAAAGRRAKGSWDEVIRQMGQRGWEIATTLETPESLTGMVSSTITTNILIFFQRPLLAQPPTTSGSGDGYLSYDAVVDPGTAPSDPSASPRPPPVAAFN